jgi:hypothetical protein
MHALQVTEAGGGLNAVIFGRPWQAIVKSARIASGPRSEDHFHWAVIVSAACSGSAVVLTLAQAAKRYFKRTPIRLLAPRTPRTTN